MDLGQTQDSYCCMYLLTLLPDGNKKNPQLPGRWSLTMQWELRQCSPAKMPRQAHYLQLGTLAYMHAVHCYLLLTIWLL